MTMLGFITRAAAAIRGVSGEQLVPATTRAVPKRGTREMLAAYSASPVLQSVARKIAFAVASTEWHAATMVDGREQRLDGHLMARLLNGGVPGLDGLQCRMATELHLLLVGEAFSVLDRNMLGAPVRRWPAAPHWVRETPRPGHAFFDVQPDGGTSMKLPADDVLWMKDVDPLRPYERGSGIGMALDDELSADEYAAKHVANSLANRARPDIIVSGSKEAPMEEGAVARLSEIWPQRFGGPNRAGLPMFSRGPVEVHDLTPNFQELQLTSLRAYERDIIVSVFGVPPELVGILANSNRATIESAEFLFTKHVIKPRLMARAAAINDQLALQYDAELYAVFDDPVDEDVEARRAYIAANPDVFTVDERRAAVGHEPLPDGAGRNFALQFTTIYGQHQKGAAARMGVTKAATVKAPDDAMGAFSDDWFEPSLTSAYRATVTDFAAAALADIGVEIAFDVFDPVVSDWISTQAAARSKLIVGATRDALRVTLSEGVAAGEATGDLVKRIQATVTDAGATRARTIARTEIVQASNFATTEAHREAGIEEREWLATSDNEVREAHVEVDGQVRGIDEPFEVNGAQAMYPGGFGVAELDINCYPGDTYVSGAPILGLKALYAGKVVEIETAAGNRLTVTSNHPVMTISGLQPAHSIREGDYLLCDGGDVRDSRHPVKHQVDHEVSSAADVFVTLSGSGFRLRAGHAVEDLHGDAAGVQDGYIEVVAKDGALLLDYASSLVKRGRHVVFGRADGATLGSCEGAEVLRAAGLAFERSDCGGLVLAEAGDHGVTPLARYGTPSEMDRLGLASDGDSACDQGAAHSGGVAPHGTRNGADALPVAVKSDRAGGVKAGAVGVVDRLMTGGDHLPGQSGSVNAEFARKIGDALAVDLSSDEVVKVRNVDFSGHVYDFQSAEGLMIASGIIVSNCRCAVLPKFPNEITGAKRKAAWLKVEGGRASHERALEAALVRDFAALSERIAAALEG